MLPAITLDVKPSRPTNVTVSVNREIASVPVSPAMLRVVAIATLAAEVKRPLESTAKVGICVAPPYVPAATPEFDSVNGTFAFAEPSTETWPVASPETPISRAVCQVVAVVELPM